MGCCGSSKSKEHEDRLVNAEAQVKAAVWHGRDLDTPGGLDVLQSVIGECVAAHLYFYIEAPTKDMNKIERTCNLVTHMAEELVKLVDVDLVQKKGAKGKVLVERLQALGAELDRSNITSAGARVEQKYRQTLAQIAQDKIALAANAIKNVGEPSTVERVAEQALKLLQEARESVRDVSELVPALMTHCGTFGNRILKALHARVDDDPSVLVPLADLAQRLDAMCETLPTDGRKKWPSLHTKVERMRTEKSADLVPGLLDGLEAQFKEGLEYPPKVLKTLKALGALGCDSSGAATMPEAASRLSAAVAELDKRTADAFDQALMSGAADRLERLVDFAKELDKQRPLLVPGRTPPDGVADAFSKDLEKRKAGVTLKHLLGNLDGNVTARTHDLHEVFVDAESAIKGFTRERLKQRAESCRWMFKIANGGFKEFSAAKSAEVEALYQKWLAKGKPKDEKERRYEIVIEVEAPRPSGILPDADDAGGGADGLRTRCMYGEKCFRKNPQHRKDFSHPGDDDWEAVAEVPCPPVTELPLGSATSTTTDASKEATRLELRYSLDFMLMTQRNASRKAGGVRSIKRAEGMTFAERGTATYFSRVKDFIKEMENIFAKAEVELRLLDESERKEMQSQTEKVLQALRPAVSEFLGLAVFVEDTKVIDDVVAMLGVRAEGLGVKHSLKEIRLRDVIDEMRLAYEERQPAATAPKSWALVRFLTRQRLLRARCALMAKRDELESLTRRNVQMKCQALLGEYDGDEEFAAKFRQEAGVILAGAMWQCAVRGPPEVLQGILRTAVSWQCDLTRLRELAWHYVQSALSNSCKSKLQPLSRVVEVLDAAQEIAKAGQVDLPSLGDMSPFTAPLAQRTVREVQETLQSDRDYPLPACVNKAKEVRTKLRSPVLAKSFDESFWLGFRPWYDRLVAAEATSVQTKAVEWAAAFSEQLGQPLPPWMMNKDQMEALKLMQAALHGGSEDQLRQAVVFAKQADYKSDHQLVQMYDEAVLKLKKLKRLPSGWEVTDLLGDEAGGKMFKKVDLKGDAMHGLFQQLLDSTNAGIVTRDRAGAMPRGYRLEKVETVWNVDSWGLYMKRVDAIKEQCGRFEGAAPVKDWSRWSGEVATATIGSQILSEAKLPPLMGSANEFLMFHGTKPEAAHSIAENHFDMAFACKTGLFGAGVYLCESSSKSDEYVKPNDKGHFPTIVCRVALGRVNYIASADPTTDPGRDKMEGSCLRGDYHSVLGDRKKVRGTYREFIIYDHYQVYPHFIVWYSRIG